MSLTRARSPSSKERPARSAFAPRCPRPGRSHRTHQPGRRSARGWSWVTESIRRLSYAILTPTKLFVGGRFDSIGGIHCKNLAAIDLATGRVLPDWCPQPDDDVDGLGLSRNALYIVGQFDRVSGQPRESAAAVQPDTAAVLPWNPKFPCCADDVDVDNSIVYLAGSFEQAGGRRRYGLAAFDSTTGELLPWAPKLRKPDSAETIRVDEAAVYVGGSFSSVNAVAQSSFAIFAR